MRSFLRTAIVSLVGLGTGAPAFSQSAAPLPKTAIRAMAYLLADLNENNIGRESDTIIGSVDKSIVVYSLLTDNCIFQARTTVPPYHARQINMRTIGTSYHDDGRTVTAFGEIGTYCDSEIDPSRSSEFPLKFDTSWCGVFRFSPHSNYERDMKKRIIHSMSQMCPQSPRR